MMRGRGLGILDRRSVGGFALGIYALCQQFCLRALVLAGTRNSYVWVRMGVQYRVLLPSSIICHWLLKL